MILSPDSLGVGCWTGRGFMPRGGATAYRVVCVSVCLLDFLQDGTESAAENCNISITREYLENDGLRFSI